MPKQNKSIQALMNRYVAGQMTPEEVDALFAFLQREDMQEELYRAMDAVDVPGSFAKILPEERKQWLLEQIAAQRSEIRRSSAVRRSHLLRMTWYRYAAALVILFAAGAYFWITVKAKNDFAVTASEAPVLNDIPPGGQKAVLMLADGTTIILDSVSNGKLAMQGSSEVVKLSSGEIAYRLKGERTSKIAYNTMRTPRGGQYQVILPDGTKVWLNAASSITYPTSFTSEERTVQITGEVYFEVASNPAIPFKIKLANATQIEVLGTHFNINAYENESSSTTTLIEGSIRLSTKNEPGVVLKPGQQAVCAGLYPSIRVIEHADIDKAMAWKNGLFNFEDADLQQVMKELVRWYDIEVVYESGIPDIQFFGKMSRNIGLAGVIKALKKTGVHFRIEEGRRLVVMR